MADPHGYPDEGAAAPPPQGGEEASQTPSNGPVEEARSGGLSDIGTPRQDRPPYETGHAAPRGMAPEGAASESLPGDERPAVTDRSQEMQNGQSTAEASRVSGTAHWLSTTIESEIIPRLLMVHRATATTEQPMTSAATAIGGEDVARLETLLLTGDDGLARDFVMNLRAKGVGLETIYMELLAPAARYLGEGWDDDRLDFAHVTFGLARLHRLLHELRSDSVMPDFQEGDGIRRILIAPAPQEQHTLGVLILCDFFRNDGWRVDEELGPTREDLAAMVEQTHFDALGLSISCDRWLEDARETVRSVRRASCNPNLRIILGGNAFVEDPDLARRLGADVVALNGRDAVAKMNELVRVTVKH